MPDPDRARRDRVIAAVWTTMERQRFPHLPHVRIPIEDAFTFSSAYGRAVEIAEAVLAADRR